MSTSSVPEETVNDADPQLRHPGRFFRRAFSDLEVARSMSRRMLALNLRARYRQSILGYVWLVATPLSIAGVWFFLHRSQIVKFGDTGVPYGAYVTTGVLLWTAFLRVLNIPLQQLQSSRGILSKIGFPWESLLIAGWGEALLETVVYLAVIVGVYAVYGIPLVPIFIAIPAILVFLLLGAAVGGLLAPFGVLYEDVPRLIGVVTYLLFFLIPIVYPVPTANPGLRVVLANPAAVLLVTARELMMSQAVSHANAAIAWGVGAVLLFFLAWITFRLSVPHLVSKL